MVPPRFLLSTEYSSSRGDIISLRYFKVINPEYFIHLAKLYWAFYYMPNGILCIEDTVKNLSHRLLMLLFYWARMDNKTNK